MHAIQDASIPHHSAGCSGNWHQQYEAALDLYLPGFMANRNFKNRIKELFNFWNIIDENPPSGLSRSDYSKIPNTNWKIEWLVTWMALNSYKSYKDVYNNFEEFHDPNSKDLMELTAKSIALCMFTLNNIFDYERIMEFVISQLKIINFSDNIFQLVVFPYPSSMKRIGVFSTRSNADLALKVIKRYEMNQMNSINKSFYYFLSNEKTPGINYLSPIPLDVPELPGEQHFDMDLESLHVKTIRKIEYGKYLRKYYHISDSLNTYFDFKDNKYDAYLALYLIKKHGFNRFCWIGTNDNPEMSYLLKRLNNAPTKWQYGPIVFKKRSVKNILSIQ